MSPRSFAALALVAGALVAVVRVSVASERRPTEAPPPTLERAAVDPELLALVEHDPLPDASVAPAAPPPPLRRASPSATPALSETENLLLVGIDRRPGTARGGRPDTLLVAVLDERSSHVGLISVPRDLYVDFPGHGPARINTAYSVARKLGEEPRALLRSVVEDTLSLTIAHTIEIDLGGFEALIDSLGGVDVDVPCPIVDRFVDPRAEGGRRPLSVEAGRQHFDGVTAAMYVRSRHGRSDFSRARRQQAVTLGIRRRLGEPTVLARVPWLLSAASSMVATDLGALDLARLARRAASIEPSHLHGLVFGAKETIPTVTEDGRSVLLPRYEAIDHALAHLFEAPSPGERPGRRACPAPDVALAPRAP